MSGGHQIVKRSGATRHADRLLRIPRWTQDDAQVQEVLLRAFPKLKTDERQRERAGTWYRIIYFYYRVGNTDAWIAEEMGIPRRKVKQTLTRIRRVAKGMSANGTPRKKMGRPRKAQHLSESL